MNRQITKHHLKQLIFIVFIGFTAAILSSCEKEITGDLPQPEEQIVIEGSIENGSPPLVFLSRNFAFFGQLSLAQYQNTFVNNAEVYINTAGQSFQLNEICYQDLDPSVQQIILSSIGFIDTDSIPDDFNFCLYAPIDPNNILNPPTIIGEQGKSYELDINVEGKSFSAITTIPEPVELDSIYFQQHPEEGKDTLYRMFAVLNDPDTLGNYYRYFTQQNEEASYPGLSSVFDDLFINGSTFFFPLDRAQPRSADFDLDTYGYFTLGDTVTLRWTNIDAAHYQFWKTLEFNADTQGPFSGATQVDFNIEGEGGIGIWGGYGASYYTIIAE